MPYHPKNKVTIICGAPASGKTALAKHIAAGRKAAYLPGHLAFENEFMPAHFNASISVIVVDEIQLQRAQVTDRIKQYAKSETLVVNRKFRESFEMKTPLLVISTNDCLSPELEADDSINKIYL